MKYRKWIALAGGLVALSVPSAAWAYDPVHFYPAGNSSFWADQMTASAGQAVLWLGDIGPIWTILGGATLFVIVGGGVVSLFRRMGG